MRKEKLKRWIGQVVLDAQTKCKGEGVNLYEVAAVKKKTTGSQSLGHPATYNHFVMVSTLSFIQMSFSFRALTWRHFRPAIFGVFSTEMMNRPSRFWLLGPRNLPHHVDWFRDGWWSAVATAPFRVIHLVYSKSFCFIFRFFPLVFLIVVIILTDVLWCCSTHARTAKLTLSTRLGRR